jgi:hypothetical protein
MSAKCWSRVALILGGLMASNVAAAQTQRCGGETWAALAADRYQDERLGPLLAHFNRLPDTDRCPKEKFVRLPARIRHQVQLGQTLKAVAARFCRGSGAQAYLRSLNQLPEGTEPATDQQLIVPAELELSVGARPEAELSQLFGLPTLETIRAYNGLGPKDPFTPGGTVYVPLLLELKGQKPPEPGAKLAPSPAPVPAPSPAPTPPPSAAPQASIAPAAALTTALTDRFRPVDLLARPADFAHPTHRAALGTDACEFCHAPDPRQPGRYQPIAEETCRRCHATFEPSDPLGPLRAIAPGLRSPAPPVARGQGQGPGLHRGVRNLSPRRPEAAGTRALPGHPECQACHNDTEVKPAIVQDCQGCHGPAERVEQRRLQRATLHEHYRGGERGTDVFFGHPIHLAALPADGDQTCLLCHASVKTAASPIEIRAPKMADCLSCHRGLVQTLLGEDTDLERCRTCHLSTNAQVAPVFGALLDKPLSHSGTFRRRHGPEAAADDGVCASCHFELAGDRGQECQRCHQQIRPADHGPRFRDDPHGRAAVRDPDRCATCHLRERCADCHNEPPRDHFPRATFQLRHARQARVTPRRCLTCHSPEADCARCHDVLRQ